MDFSLINFQQKFIISLYRIQILRSMFAHCHRKPIADERVWNLFEIVWFNDFETANNMDESMSLEYGK